MDMRRRISTLGASCGRQTGSSVISGTPHAFRTRLECPRGLPLGAVPSNAMPRPGVSASPRAAPVPAALRGRKQAGCQHLPTGRHGSLHPTGQRSAVSNAAANRPWTLDYGRGMPLPYRYLDTASPRAVIGNAGTPCSFPYPETRPRAVPTHAHVRTLCGTLDCRGWRQLP